MLASRYSSRNAYLYLFTYAQERPIDFSAAIPAAEAEHSWNVPFIFPSRGLHPSKAMLHQRPVYIVHPIPPATLTLAAPGRRNKSASSITKTYARARAHARAHSHTHTHQAFDVNTGGYLTNLHWSAGDANEESTNTHMTHLCLQALLPVGDGVELAEAREEHVRGGQVRPGLQVTERVCSGQ